MMRWIVSTVCYRLALFLVRIADAIDAAENAEGEAPPAPRLVVDDPLEDAEPDGSASELLAPPPARLEVVRDPPLRGSLAERMERLAGR